MKILTCASYYGTGSSAVTDLINECDNVHSMGDYEFRFIQDPDGICDLEYNLVLNNHRHNSGYAIRRYERNVNFLNGSFLIKKYNRFFGKQWMALSRHYIDSLVAVKYKGYWHQEVRDKGFFVYAFERILDKVMHKIMNSDKDRNYTLFMRNNIEYASNPGELFYELTKEYIDSLFAFANDDNKEFVMVDQLVPPSNTSHYLKFFNDLKVICVDRDPRDLYIAEKVVYNGTIVPRDVDSFCRWYQLTRKHRMYEKDDPKRIMRISFEDLIYRYDSMSESILEFCGIDKVNHIWPKTKLIPETSRKNTMLYKQYAGFEKEVSIIEMKLSDYLYDFNQY